MARTITFDFRRGGGSAEEYLFGDLTLTPTHYHEVGTAVVLSEGTKVGLINGQATLANVEATPTGATPAWVYRVTVTPRTSTKAWSFLVGVPEGTGSIAFKDLPRYSTPGSGITIVGGASAYQTAVANGFVGSETQWLTSLKGAKGDTGAPGAPGSNTVPTDAAVATNLTTPSTLTGQALLTEVPKVFARTYKPTREAFSAGAPTVWTNLGYKLSLADMRANMLAKSKRTIYYPSVVKVPSNAPGRLGNYYLYWSTDHDNNTGGIFMAYADHPEGPWTCYYHPDNWVWRDSGTNRGNQTETPWVIHDGTKFIMYYQNKGTSLGLGVQTTLCATSTDGKSWVPANTGLLWPSLDLPGDGHTGYAHVYKVGDRFVAYSSASGTSYSRQAIWHSTNGTAFTLDRELFSDRVNISQDNALKQVFSPRLFEWRNELWGAAVIKSASSGLGDAAVADSYVGRIREDMRGFKGGLYKANEAGNCYIEHDGTLYTFGIYYNKADTNDNNGGVSVSRLEV